jgi:PAS domain S-box-containing protein
MKLVKFFIECFLIALISLSNLEIAGADNLEFTKKEKTWLSQHHSVRARVGGAPPLHFYDGKFRGISVEYLNLIAERAGFNVQYITDIPWSTALENIKNHQELDLILTAKNTPERQKTMVFTEDYLLMAYAIFCRKDTDFIQTIENLENIKVSVEQDYVIHKKLSAEYPKIKLVIKKTSEEAIKAIALGEADAYIGNLTMTSFIIQKNNLTNLKVTAPTPFENHNQAMAIRDDWPELAGIINKTFDTLTQEAHKKILEKWSSPSINQNNSKSVTPDIKSRLKDISINLSQKEKNWLLKHPSITVHNERNWPPFNYNLNDKPTGLSIDYMNILANRIGIEVAYITGEWGELLEMAFNKKLDVMLNIVSTPERRKQLLYASSYMRNPNVIVAKKDSNISGIESLFNKRVSFPSGFFYEKLLKAQYPQIKRVPVKDLLASLKEVEFDRADAALGELAVVNYLIRENHLSDLVAKHEFSTGNPEIEKLNIAVRNDWPELQSILTKAMASISEEEIQKLKNKWMHQTDYNKYENQESQPGISIWRLIVYGLVIFLFVSLLFWVMIRFIKKEHISIKYGSTWFRLLVLAGLSIFLVVVFVIGWINLERSREMHLEDESRFLTGVLSVVQDRLDLWLTERKSFMKQLGSNPRLVAITKRLLEVLPEKKALLASNELQEIRSFFKKSDDIFPNIGFFIIDPDYISIGSMRDSNVGTLNLIMKEHPELLKKAFLGEVGFVPPTTSDVQLTELKKNSSAKKPPTMFFIGPIRDVDENVISVFTLRVDPWRDFSKAISSFEGFKSSEIYTFDENGYLLTPSSFDQQLRGIGLLADDQGSALNIEIRDPGVNLLEGKSPKQERSKQPLTHLVLRTLALKKQMEEIKSIASHSKIETDMTGYRDYRGVPVFGAWLWNAHLKIGLATEVNLDEALADYTTTRFMVITILGFTLFLSVGAVLLVLVLGERASRTLTKARDNLENEVEKRTSELQKNQEQLKTADERSRLLLNSAGEGIFGVDTTGKINFVNPSALNLLGYSESEMLGKEAHQLIHHSHGDGTHYDSAECPMYQSFVYGKSGKVTDEVLWRKNETQFDVEYSSIPIVKDSKIIGAVITFLDVTERKKAVEKVRKSEELLNRALKLAKMGGWEYSVDGGLFWTQEVYDIHGIKSGMIEKEPDRDWIGDSINCYQKKDAERINAAFSKALSKGIPYDLTLRFKPWNGEEIWVRTTGEPMVKDGKIIRVIGLLADIDEQKKMEEALIAEKSHLQKVLDTSPVGVVISVGGIMRFANPKIMEMFDLILGDPAPQFYVNTGDRDHIMNTLKSHGIIEGYELQMFGKNEEIKDMLVSYMTITYERQGAVLGWVMDITNLKKTDRELRQQFDEMSRFRKLAVGRELKMVDIKKEINDLLDQLGKESKYKIVSNEKNN